MRKPTGTGTVAAPMPRDGEPPPARVAPDRTPVQRNWFRDFRRNRRVRRILLPSMFIAPVLVYAVLFFGYPLAYGIVMSFQRLGFAAMVQGSGTSAGFSNYRAALSDPVTMTALRNTVIFTIASVVLQVGIGLAIAVLLSKSFLLAGFLRRLVLVPWLIPLLATGTVFSLLFGAQGGPINIVLQHLHLVHSPVPWLIEAQPAIIAIIAVNVWAGLPFNIIVLYSGLTDIDPLLYEAADIDGAGPVQRFWRITLPMLRPVLLIVSMLGVIGTVNVFDIVWLMTGGGPNNATQLLSTWSYTQGFVNFNFGEGAAIANFLLIISFVLALFYLRSLRAKNQR